MKYDATREMKLSLALPLPDADRATGPYYYPDNVWVKFGFVIRL